MSARPRAGRPAAGGLVVLVAVAGLVGAALTAAVPRAMAAGATVDPISFGKSLLAGETSTRPTSLQFGPDGRLYVLQQDGTLKIYQVARNAANAYAVTATETVSLVKNIPNHDDDGTPDPAVNTRQATG